MVDFLRVKECDTIEIKIFIAGDYQQIKRVCNDFCESGFCVSVKQADYIYKYGQESGAEITIIEYPRFPLGEAILWNKAESLAEKIGYECNQGSFTIVWKDRTYFYSRRDGD